MARAGGRLQSLWLHRWARRDQPHSFARARALNSTSFLRAAFAESLSWKLYEFQAVTKVAWGFYPLQPRLPLGASRASPSRGYRASAKPILGPAWSFAWLNRHSFLVLASIALAPYLAPVSLSSIAHFLLLLPHFSAPCGVLNLSHFFAVFGIRAGLWINASPP